MRVASIAGLLLMMAGVGGLISTHAILSSSPPVVVAQVAAAALMLWARLTFGRRSLHAAADPTEGGLVMTGPYRFIRHPIYTAICLFCWAAVLAHLSVMSVVFGGLVTVGAFIRMISEERLLVERYPGYRQYALVTKRMVPHVF